jgi:hypothetical protein
VPLTPARITLNTLLGALLLMLLACLGDQHHAPEQPHRHSAVMTSGTDVSEPAGHCHDLNSESAAFPQSSSRTTPPAVATEPSTHVPAHVPSDAARRHLPSGGRSALPVLCRWRI